jgi:hypothetical protein
MMMVHLAVLTAATLVAGQSVSNKTLMGAGTVSCGEWLKVRSTQSPNSRDLAAHYQMRACPLRRL